MSVKKSLVILFKAFSFLFVFVLVIGILVLLGLNLFKFAYYKDYYKVLTKEGKNPGLNENYVPQGVSYFDNLILTCGYMSDGKNSRIYTVDCVTGDISYFPLISGGRRFEGHTGGLQYLDGYIYLANEGNSLYKFTAASVLQKSGTTIEIGDPITLNSNTSFVYGKDEYLYVGEFHKEEAYPCENIIEYDGKTHNAIVEKYHISDLTKPLEVYSIPGLVQGFCIKDDGTILLSTSWSVNSSNLYIYEPAQIVKTGKKYNDADVYFLTEPTRTIKAPAMSEDLDIIRGENGEEKILTTFESACNKYFYGKFFFANYIAGLKL